MLNNRLYYRMYMRSPFPFDKRQLFEALLPDSIIKAARTIETSDYHKRLNQSRCFNIKGGPLEFTIELDEGTFLLNTQSYGDDDFEFARLSEETQETLLKWGKFRLSIIEEGQKFLDRLQSLFDAASTWGMFVRVWPDFRALLVETEHAKHFFAEQKARSRLPDKFNPKYADIWEDGKLWDSEFMNLMLAQLLLIGDPDSDPDDGVAVTWND